MDNIVTIQGEYAEITCVHKGSPYYCKVSMEDLGRVERLGHVGILYNVDKGKCYARTRVDGSQCLLHRYLCNATKDDVITFVDGNSLNCTRSNMLVGTRSVASRQQIVVHNRSDAQGTIGVRDVQSRVNRYVVRIMDTEGVRHYVGSYRDRDEAIQVRRWAEENMWGM